MNHAITVGGLLSALGVMIGVPVTAFGALMLFAASMSDAGDDGTGGAGCAVILLGIVVLVAGVAGLVL